MKLENKVILITGASRGIGASIAEQFSQRGAIVVGTATTEDQVNNITKKLAFHHGLGKLLDVKNDDQITSLISEIIEQFGRIDVLINNAGVTQDNIVLRMKEKEWDEVLEVNLKSIFRTSRAVLKHMIKAKSGRIINISSVIGLTGNIGQSNYSASKAGMVAFTKSLAQEIGVRNVTVNCVAPGFIHTDMTEKLSEDILTDLLKRIPLGRVGDAKNIADAVLFLASESASYITGQTIHVNGGMLMP